MVFRKKKILEVENPTSPCAGLRALWPGCRSNLPFFVPWDFGSMAML